MSQVVQQNSNSEISASTNNVNIKNKKNKKYLKTQTLKM